MQCKYNKKMKNPLSSIDICRSVKLDTKNRARETGYKQGDQQGVRLEITYLYHIHFWKWISQSPNFLYRVAPVTTCNVAFSHLSSLIEIMRRVHHRQASRATLILFLETGRDLEEGGFKIGRTAVVDLCVYILSSS